MSQRTLYAYLEDPDPPGAVDSMVEHVRFFLGETGWRRARPFLVDQPLEEVRPRRPGEPSERDVGLHVRLPPPEERDDDWREDLLDLVSYLLRLRAETGNNLVVGIFDRDGVYAEDLAFLDRAEPDLSRLAEALDVTFPEPPPAP